MIFIKKIFLFILAINIMVDCIVCYEEQSGMIKCCNNHNMCLTCIASYLKSKISIEEIQDVFKDETLMFCMAGKNCSQTISLYQIIKLCSEDLFNDLYFQWKRCSNILIEYSIIKEQENIKIHNAHEKELFDKTQTVIDMLSAKCPGCSQVFDNFTGCFSLQCFKCSCYFCGWCLNFHTKSNQDTHRHVRTCQYNKRKGDYYGEISDFQEMLSLQIMKKINKLVEQNDIYVYICDNLKIQLNLHNLYLNQYGFIEYVPSNKLHKSITPPKPVPPAPQPRRVLQPQRQQPRRLILHHDDEIIRYERYEINGDEIMRRYEINDDFIVRHEVQLPRPIQAPEVRHKRKCGKCRIEGHDRRNCPN
jgi:hypothetical protein